MKKVFITAVIFALLVVTPLVGCAEKKLDAKFSASPRSGTAPLTVQFTDQSTGDIDTWAWDFYNDGTVDSTQQNPTHVYETAGNHTVSLTVTGPGGSDTETKTDYISISSEPNEVQVFFDTISVHSISQETFSNRLVPAYKIWQTRLENSSDASAMPVTGLELDYTTVIPFSVLSDQNLTRRGPPTYTWSFGKIHDGSRVGADAGFGPDRGPDLGTSEHRDIMPGFDASRAVDQTLFSSPGNQTLTVTVTPREEREEELFVRVFTNNTAYVEATITSPIGGNGIELSQDRHWLTIYGISTELNTSTSVTITIQVTPKVPQAEFLPDVWLGWRETVNSGTAKESSISRDVEGLGTWTVTAEGNYIWNWEESTSYGIRWPQVSRGIAATDNRVRADFAIRWDYLLWADDFTNREVNGARTFFTALLNEEDETGEPIKDLCLTLTTDLETKEVREENLVRWGPPSYEWFFGDEPERTFAYLATGAQSCDAYAWFPLDVNLYGTVDTRKIEYASLHPGRWTPGFDFSRSADNTVFTSPGTQTLTVTVIPREEKIDKLTVEILSLEENEVSAAIISSTQEVYLNPASDQHRMYWNDIPMQVNTPWSVTLTIRVTPKVPKVEFIPYVVIIWNGLGWNWEPLQGLRSTTSGSFVSYSQKEMGTWTWSADGDYVWEWWYQPPHYCVGLHARHEALE